MSGLGLEIETKRFPVWPLTCWSLPPSTASIMFFFCFIRGTQRYSNHLIWPKIFQKLTPYWPQPIFGLGLKINTQICQVSDLVLKLRLRKFQSQKLKRGLADPWSLLNSDHRLRFENNLSFVSKISLTSWGWAGPSSAQTGTGTEFCLVINKILLVTVSAHH